MSIQLDGEVYGLSWVIVRGQESDSYDECLARGDDLARRVHVQRVLSETFRGSVETPQGALWRRPSYVLRFDIGSAERVQAILVSVELVDASPADVIAELSPRFRRLKEKRFWQVFDDASKARIEWNPAAQRKYRLSSLQLMPIPFRDLPKDIGDERVYYISAKSDDDVFEVLDAIMSAAGASAAEGEHIAVGSQSAVVRLASGTHLYGVFFRKEWDAMERAMRYAPELAARVIASVGDGELVFPRSGESAPEDTVQCFTYKW